MDPELCDLLDALDARRRVITSLCGRYRATQDRAGVSLRCLDPEAGDAPAPAEIERNEDNAVTVRVQGPIDDWFGFDVRELIRALDEAAPASIRLLLESPGGFLLDGLAFYVDLRARARAGVKVTAEARGVVASAAVLPFLAADERIMTTGTQLMVHDPWSLVVALGTSDEIEGDVAKIIQALRAGEKSLRDVLSERTGKSRQKVGAWLKDETWFLPDEAAAAGFATAVIEDAAARTERDEQARALARRVMAQWKLKMRKEAA